MQHCTPNATVPFRILPPTAHPVTTGRGRDFQTVQQVAHITAPNQRPYIPPIHELSQPLFECTIYQVGAHHITAKSISFICHSVGKPFLLSVSLLNLKLCYISLLFRSDKKRAYNHKIRRCFVLVRYKGLVKRVAVLKMEC